MDDDAPVITERLALAYLCARLPAVRVRAERGSWSDELQWRMDNVAEGGSALSVCRELGLLDDLLEEEASGPAYRDAGPPGSAGGRLPGLAEVTLTGRYACPEGRCARRGQRDDGGRPPTCELTGRPMMFRADP